MTTSREFRLKAVLSLAATVLLVSCTSPPTENVSNVKQKAPTGDIAAVCDNRKQGPDSAPAGAVVVDPNVDSALLEATETNPPGTTFWLAPGTHTLGTHKFGQVMPKDGNTYLGSQGAVLDGRGKNMFAFTGHASDITIKYLTIEGFVAPNNQGVVNHDSGNGWVIAHNTVQKNKGAALMAGSHQIVRGNCIRNNGQYGMNAYQAGNEITDLLMVGNEIVGNNTDDWESKKPGCGCSGAIKFWSVDGAVIRNNWIHDNHGTALWADTNNNDFLIEGNLIENNEGQAIFYETSYNAIIRNNVIRGNAIVSGREFAEEDDNFPVAAIYISESGGEPEIAARTDKIEIYGNLLMNNWSGITLWENADRFCNSPANPTEDCTLLVDEPEKCTRPGITSAPLYDDCRWKTKRVFIHDNKFVTDLAAIDCTGEFCSRMALLSNWGTYPEWSPYKKRAIQEAITFEQNNHWRDNTYVGPWSFVAYDTSRALTVEQWRTKPYVQDRGSTFTHTEHR